MLNLKHTENFKFFKKCVSIRALDYKNELNKASFPHDAAYSDNKDLAKNYFR